MSSQPVAVRSLVDAQPTPFWLADPARPATLPALVGDERCDLLVIGGGYCGLWTALLAKERNPGRDVVLLESHEIGWAASGRNGGFVSASLTHGLNNGLRRWPDELSTLLRLGQQNLDEIEASLRRYNIDCEWERTGELDVAIQPHQVAQLRAQCRTAEQLGANWEFLEADAIRAKVNSPTYLAAVWDRTGVAMVHPAKLAWGLRAACLRLGVRIYERSPATELTTERTGSSVRTPYGRVRASRVALATNAFRPLVPRLRHYVIPVYDHVLVTEPLSAEQLASIGWRERQGVADASNLFHYYRLTADNRIIWGGYDVIYHFRSALRAELDQRPATFGTLAGHFFRTFPSLEGVRFSHSWGGAIDTCSRFAAFFGTLSEGRVGYALGYTGLGVAATRFGAQVMLDLIDRQPTERTALRMVRETPLPYPPEPLRWVGARLTCRSMARADAHGGRRNLWLRTLDATGLGFDS
ncbi:MAG TPA: FAD-dependent oxidoreductase [Pseudonocardia sp.]|jgi:glycine/D-amino acid oxidase-like deaminating enzyme